ncbi:MAG: coproporphyrinogen dehydrogenase HemZ [Firmicutes bacterium]|nr:coproporphyrinogen dehydrogenase HemZ [Bacillota bacterium]
MKIQTNLEKYLNDYQEVANLFFPNFENQDEHQIEINISREDDNSFDLKIVFDSQEKDFHYDYISNQKNVEDKKWSKIFLYDALSSFTGKTFEWGALTGVRPTKIAYKLLEQGVDELFLKEELMKQYRLSENKATLLKETIKNQKCIIKNDNLVDVYINIPICPSRCRYCSFISAEYNAVQNLIPAYLEALKKEIDGIKKIILKKTLIVRSIYIGGGTPSVLSAQQLDDLLSELNFNVNEFTVECGRADTITKEKLQVLKKHGVTRICINPQTFVEKTLKLIGRKHTVKDVLNAYAMALEFGFDINIDLIAGLTGETFSNFKKSINYALEMAPQNITVHTLALKRGSNMTDEKILNLKKKENLSTEEEIALHEQEVKKMIDYGHKRLFEEGYKPYYLYRQKNTPLGLENVGFAQKGKVCIFNVDSMEETCSVLACGANAVSKRVFSLENRIERCDNVKFINDYLARLDEMIERKEKLFS